jgi:hypothetical protein
LALCSANRENALGVRRHDAALALLSKRVYPERQSGVVPPHSKKSKIGAHAFPPREWNGLLPAEVCELQELF